MQSVSSRIWTRVAVFISYDDYDYTTGTSFVWSLVMITLRIYLSIWLFFYLTNRFGHYFYAHTHTHTHRCKTQAHTYTPLIYIYIYMCVCVCVCVDDGVYTLHIVNTIAKVIHPTISLWIRQIRLFHLGIKTGIWDEKHRSGTC